LRPRLAADAAPNWMLILASSFGLRPDQNTT
jgi:hypothetical protein